jgi:hypothetical protein
MDVALRRELMSRCCAGGGVLLSNALVRPGLSAPRVSSITEPSWTMVSIRPLITAHRSIRSAQLVPAFRPAAQLNVSPCTHLCIYPSPHGTIVSMPEVG